ncbi:hypothetical protein NBO_11g0031 [Nosema bombycis CQ1]|uniref:Uncharacterized protein n=1 Tax=Nosema bombycis (strain CQ1 / CVCC 102059) TaxID=578461 RepID=R0MAI5_NOSB1|nr:hypothetical protein NBO_11g0031 [Nosema bombycis CQ1]|eukprot:EOB14959.1 hypothetical protein NBO_11g0031 [Nosema bombycis CQ1]
MDLKIILIIIKTYLVEQKHFFGFILLNSGHIFMGFLRSINFEEVKSIKCLKEMTNIFL